MKAYFGYAPAIIVPRLVSAFILIIFSRILGAEQIGMYSLIFVIGEYLDTIFFRWIRAGYVRLYSNYAAEGQQIERAVLVLGLPGLFLSIGFAIVYVLLNADLDMKWAGLLILYVAANTALYQGLQFLRMRKEILAYTGIEAGRSLIGFGIALILNSLIGPRYEWLVIGTQSLTAAAALWLLWRMLRADRASRLTRALLNKLARYSIPLSLSFFLAGTALVLDRVMLEHYYGPAALGIYMVSYQLARPVIDILFNIINVGGFPKLVEAYEAEGDIGAQRVLSQKSVAIAIATFPALALFLSSGPLIADLLLTDEFAEATPSLLAIVALASFLRGLERFLTSQVFLLRKTTIDISLNLIPEIIGVLVASVILIPRFEIQGAALAFLIGCACGLTVSFIRAQRQIAFNVLSREVGVIAALSLACGLLLYVTSRNFGLLEWICASMICCVLYGLVLRQVGIIKLLRD